LGSLPEDDLTPFAALAGSNILLQDIIDKQNKFKVTTACAQC